MDRLTAKQVATLLVRFLGFNLLLYGVIGLLDAPGYWIRSSFGHGNHHLSGNWLDRSYDINLLMYYLREAAHFIVGLFLFRKPGGLAHILTKPFASDPEI
jgi:hypothetical protein